MPADLSLRLLAVLLAIALGLTAVFTGLEALGGEPPGGVLDVVTDFAEAAILVGAMALSALAVRRIERIERDTASLQARVGEAARAGSEWRRQSQLLLQGLGEAVDAQFRRWGLTLAEAEIAGLILKGLSSKEIARARGTSEATVRQQAQSVYRKSGLGNRAELAAYFLEDIFDVGARRIEEPDETRPGSAAS